MWETTQTKIHLISELNQTPVDDKRLDFLLQLAYLSKRDIPNEWLDQATQLLNVPGFQSAQLQQAHYHFIAGYHLFYQKIERHKAQLHLEQALKLYRALDNKRGTLESLVYLADLFNREHNHEEAYNYIEQARQLIRQHDFPESVLGQFYYKTGSIYLKLELYEIAEEYGNHALQIGYQLERPLLIVGGLWLLSILHTRQQKFETALNYAQQYLAYAVQQDVHSWFVSALTSVVVCYCHSDQLEEAIALMNSNFESGRLARDSECAADCYVEIGKAFIAEQQWLKAAPYLQDAAEVYEQHDILKTNSDCLRLLSEVYAALGNYQKAYKLMQSYNGWQIVQMEIAQKKEAAKQATTYELKLKMQETKLLKETNEALRRLHQHKDEVFQIVTHDLKNPISAALLNVHMLQEYSLAPDDKRVNRIVEALITMNEIVTQLSDIAQADPDLLEPEFGEIDLAAALQSSVNQFVSVALDKKQQLRVNSLHPVKVLGQPIWLKQIFSNLISNALKYSHEESVITIDSYVDQASNQVVVSVADNGLGFSGSDLAHLFQKYTKLSAKPTGNEPSTGLGLYIVKQMVDRMNGTVSVESAGKDKGSTFIVRFPIASKRPQIK